MSNAVSAAIEEQIREAAYHMWKNEGEPEGKHEEHWHRAHDALTTPKPKRKAAPKKAASAKSTAAKTTAKKAAPRKRSTAKAKPSEA
ncbi:MAG: DUF2934 domain-containing protein [Maritimibacter sp.]|jgi:hypothetical protein